MTTTERIAALSHDFCSEIEGAFLAISSNSEPLSNEDDAYRLVSAKLDEWHIDHTEVFSPTGVIANIKGKNPGSRCIALCAKLFTSSFKEESVVPYSPPNEGVAYPIKNVADTATLLGSAKVLNTMREDFSGSIKIIFQPVGEATTNNAKLLIEQGFLENVDALIVQRSHPELECGEIGLCAGTFMASCDYIELHLEGRGGSTSKPQQSQDMVWIAANMVAELQKKIWKMTSGQEKCVLRFGQFNANGTYDAIPDNVSIKGSLRTFDENLRNRILQLIDEHIYDMARASNVKALLELHRENPVLTNDANLKHKVQSVASAYIGKENIKEMQPLYASEDLAWYSQQVPTILYMLGTSNTSKNIDFKSLSIIRKALETGIGFMSQIAFTF